MKYNLLGNTGLVVSELCFGTMTFGGSGGIWDKIGAVQQQEANELIKTSVDAFFRGYPVLYVPLYNPYRLSRFSKTHIWN